MTNPADIRDLLLRFTGPDLTQTLARIESAVRGVEAKNCEGFLEGAGVGRQEHLLRGFLRSYEIHAIGDIGGERTRILG